MYLHPASNSVKLLSVYATLQTFLLVVVKMIRFQRHSGSKRLTDVQNSAIGPWPGCVILNSAESTQERLLVNNSSYVPDITNPLLLRESIMLPTLADSMTVALVPKTALLVSHILVSHEDSGRLAPQKEESPQDVEYIVYVGRLRGEVFNRVSCLCMTFQV